jgi:predicted Zn-dependent protease
VHLIDVVPGGNDRIYMLVTAGPKGHVASDDAQRFRDSFKLVGDQPATATAPDSTGTTSTTP